MKTIKDTAQEISDLEKALETLVDNDPIPRDEADHIRGRLSASVSKLNNGLAKFQLR